MDKTYRPDLIEARWYQHWQDHGYFSPTASAAPNYCIMIPPPNVTGTLHMGHAFNNTIMDSLTRYYRMNGYNTLWQPGTDHAGIATQMVVERQLNQEGRARTDLTREQFVKRIWQWKEHSGNTISQQLKRLGSSLDWSRERFTMDAGLSAAVIEVFVRLYDEGLIYRGKRLVNWDPVLHTAVSDLEVVAEEERGHLWHLRYPLEGQSDILIVATTRPETMLGDCAVAVHPDDSRYQQYIGRNVLLPLCDRTIPIIADPYVDPEFGTGCVKITPAHDFNDYEVGQRHALPLINIFTPDAKIGPDAPAKYRNLDRYEARNQILEDLRQQDLIEKTQEHTLVVPRGDRSGAVLEPYLTDQWYVRTAPLAEPAIRAVEDGQIRFIPDNWANTYFEWMRNIQDWCISRQLWWGHRIPAWFDHEGNFYVGHSEEDVRSKYDIPQEKVLRQDEDVLDTWFSSALWPFSTLGWPEQTDELQRFYPTSVLVTGFDIIFFWVARMIMFGLKFTQQIPFRDVYIHGLVRDAQGQKMSKSKGNVIDPIDLIDGIELDALIAKRTHGLMQPQMEAKIKKETRKQFPAGIPAFGTDALRFTFAAMATTGRDVRFDLQRVEGYRNFCNKLWNASRFALLTCEGQTIHTTIDFDQLNSVDRWILSRQQELIDTVHRQIQQYRFDLCAQAIYEFTWHEFCDWYLELIKPTLASLKDQPQEAAVTRGVLLHVLECLLRLMHPIIPFITEEIWHPVSRLLGLHGESIMVAAFPLSHNAWVDIHALEQMDWLKEVISAIRKIRSERDIAPGKVIDIAVQQWNESDRLKLNQFGPLLKKLSKIGAIDYLDSDTSVPDSALALVGEMRVLVPLTGLIDKDAEMDRLHRAIYKTEQSIDKMKHRLNNKNFTAKAPPEIVAQERNRMDELTHVLEELRQQIAQLTASS